MKKLLLLLIGLAAPLGLGLAIRSLALTTDSFEFERWLEQPNKLVEPAPLTRAHRTEPGCVDCTACHELTAGGPSPKCLACHEEIGGRAAKAAGHHGRDLLGECVACHTDHVERIIEFDPDQFNHQRASFALEDRHQAVECDQCHLTPGGFHYLGLPFASCRDCHQDPHLGTLSSRECAACHTAADWKRVRAEFDHDTDTGFALGELHGGLTCAACHATSVYGETPEACAECHTEFAGFLEGRLEGGEIWPADPHSGLVTCAECHPGDERKPSAAAHARRCASCHSERYANLYLNRGLHLSGLASQDASERMALLLKVGSHNYVEAEQQARTLVGNQH